MIATVYIRLYQRQNFYIIFFSLTKKIFIDIFMSFDQGTTRRREGKKKKKNYYNNYTKKLLLFLIA